MADNRIRKAYIGYDLGDGETITDMTVKAKEEIHKKVQTLFTAMKMPDCNEPGKAIPSTFGYDPDGNLVFAESILQIPENVKNVRISFKRRPSDLMDDVSDTRKIEILQMLENGWPNEYDCPELNSEEMYKFRDAVVIFTNAIFNDADYQQRVYGSTQGCEEIVFCVGHPTKWTDFDVEVYKAILAQSVIGAEEYMGMKASMVMAAESRAAFLYTRDAAEAGQLEKGSSVLLIDIGSSTIDVTAMTADSRNHQYNSGNNYMGARSIDYMVRDWYLTKLKKDEDDWMVFQELVRDNPHIAESLLLACRTAKETVYSTQVGVTKINFLDFRPFKITRADIDKMAEEQPVSKVLMGYADLPDEAVREMADASWKELFRRFLQKCLTEMTEQGIKVGRIILTGSASQMSFVRPIVSEVFENEITKGDLLSDMNPSRSISMGLSLVGPSNDKSFEFRMDMDHFMEKELPEIIDKDLPALAEDLSSVITRRVRAIVTDKMQQWKNGRIRTLNDMTASIQAECSESRLMAMLEHDTEYNAAISKWMRDVVGKDVATKLHGLCEDYGVQDFTIEYLNVFTVSTGKIKIGDVGGIDALSNIMDILVGVLSVVAGIIAAVVLPTVLGIITGLLFYVASGLAMLIFEILMALPGVGWVLLIGIAGVAAFKAAQGGLSSAKDFLMEKLKEYDLPKWVRERISDAKLNESLDKANIRQQIKESILKAEAKKEIVESVVLSISGLISKRADEIKYAIESR